MSDGFVVYLVAGLLTGGLVGMTGVGGGALMTPLLMLVFGVKPEIVVGTDLLFAGTTKSYGVVLYGKSSDIDWKTVFLLAAGSVPLAMATPLVLPMFLDPKDCSWLVSLAVGCVLVFTSFSMVFGAKMVLGMWSGRSHAVVLPISGALLGILVSMSSIGAGALGMLILLAVMPDMSMRKRVGTNIAHAVPLALLSSVSHMVAGNVNWILLGCLLCGSLPGMFIGAKVSSKVSPATLSKVVAVLMLVSGVAVLAKTLA